MAKLLFKNGSIVYEDNPRPQRKDILIEDDRIIGVENKFEPDKSTIIYNCKDKIILPGLFDMHTHLREPGREDEETIETGTEAAINSGITAIVCMPNTDPAIDTGSVVTFVKSLSKERSRIPVYIAGCITQNRNGENFAEIGDMADKGIVMITDDGNPVSNPLMLRRAMEYSKNFNIIVSCHCEVKELSEGGVITEGETAIKLGLPGIPQASEEICIERDLRLAELTRARVHIQHISTACSLDIIKRYKERGVNVTCEVTPHHLIFSEKDIEDYDTNFKMNPPLRRVEDNRKLLDGLKNGYIDCIATDHAPHTIFEKNQDFINAPFGIIGLDIALVSIYNYLIKPKKINWNVILKTFSINPRKILGIDKIEIKKGSSAEFIVFNPKTKIKINKEFLKSKSCNTPFLNKELEGCVEKVVYKGKILLDRERL
ncbi:MAG: dihydroorotase [Candidatus Hydrogenedentota bacterium]